MKKHMLTLVALALLGSSFVEARTRPTSPLAVTAIREFRSDGPGYPSVDLDVAVSRDVVLAVWIKDDREVYAQRFSRVDLSPLGEPRLIHSSQNLDGGIRVIHDGEKFVAVWPYGNACCHPLELFRQVISEEATEAAVVASNVGALNDVVWDGRELIVSSLESITVLGAEGELLAQYEPIHVDTAFAVNDKGVHAVWQTDMDWRGCRVTCPQLTTVIETTTFARGSSITPTAVTRWSVASAELFNPDIAATADEVVVTAQRATPNIDDIVAFRIVPRVINFGRGDVVLGRGHTAAVGAFGKRFAFAWMQWPVSEGAPSSLAVRVTDATLSDVTATLSIPVDESLTFSHFSGLTKPKVIALSESHFLVAFISGRSESSLALVSAGRTGRPRPVRPIVTNEE